MQEQVLLSRQAVVGAMKCLYWLCKQEIPHTTNYEPLLALAKALGCSYLSSLSKGGNAHYTSERIIQEVVGILASQIENSQVTALSRSTYYGLMIDESTDISVTKQLVLYGRYVNEQGDPVSTLLKMIDLVDGTAQHIVETVTSYLAEKDLLLSKLMGFGSDGAAVMTGRVSSVATRLHGLNPNLVSVHCVAHRLALACAQAGQNVEYIKKFNKSLNSVFVFFQGSPVRMEGLKSIHNLLNSSFLKLKEAKDVRWLSHDAAVQALRRTLPAVLTALEREGTEHGEPVAIGLVRQMKTYDFVACLNLLYEVMPHLSHLSRLFQAEYLQLSMIQPVLNTCITNLTAYKATAGAPDVSATENAFTEQLKDFKIVVPSDAREKFDYRVRQPFLNSLLQNLADRFPSVELLSAFDIFTPPSNNQEVVNSNSQEKLSPAVNSLLNHLLK